jgi:hypothetical protein
VDAVAASIREFGFRQPIVVDPEGVIVVGHTRYKAALKLGLEKVPVQRKPNPPGSCHYTSITILDDQHLGAVISSEAVHVLDSSGKSLWRRDLAGAERVVCALPNGNLLVHCQRESQDLAVEISSKGKPVLQTFLDGAPCATCFPLIRLGFPNPESPDLDADAILYQTKFLRKGNDLANRRRALKYLYTLGAKAKPAMSHLLEALNDEDEEVRSRPGGLALMPSSAPCNACWRSCRKRVSPTSSAAQLSKRRAAPHTVAKMLCNRCLSSSVPSSSSMHSSSPAG